MAGIQTFLVDGQSRVICLLNRRTSDASQELERTVEEDAVDPVVACRNVWPADEPLRGEFERIHVLRIASQKPARGSQTADERMGDCGRDAIKPLCERRVLLKPRSLTTEPSRPVEKGFINPCLGLRVSNGQKVLLALPVSLGLSNQRAEGLPVFLQRLRYLHL